MTRGLVRAASWIVPRDTRRAWLDEWRAELSYVSRVDPAQALSFCLGAFRDALWLRRNRLSPRAPLLASPIHCVAALAAIAALAFALRPVERIPEDVIAIRLHAGRLTLTVDQYRAIAGHLPHGFTAVGFYRPVKGGPAIATPGIADVLRGAPLPRGIERYTTMDDPGPGVGYVLARVPVRPLAPHWHIRVPSASGGIDLLDCAPVAPRIPFMPLATVAVGALVILAATTSFALGRLPRLAWIFLAAKLALALTAAYYFAQLLGAPLLPQALIVGFVLTVRWALNDQRRRCPVCLQLVTNPVSFGCLSHTLLDWHGSEFVCPEGHGLLQVSATFASPYAAQQWLRL